MAITILVATEENFRAVNDIVNEGHEEHVEAQPTIFKSVEAVMPISYYKELIESDTSEILIAQEDDMLVGFAVISIEAAPPFHSLVQRKFAYIHDFGVKNAHQRKGIGKLLFEACVAWAKERDALSIELNVWEFNEKAIDFYEQLDMTTASRKMVLQIE